MPFNFDIPQSLFNSLTTYADLSVIGKEIRIRNTANSVVIEGGYDNLMKIMGVLKGLSHGELKTYHIADDMDTVLRIIYANDDFSEDKKQDIINMLRSWPNGKSANIQVLNETVYVSDLATNVMNSYNSENEKATYIVDTLTNTVENGIMLGALSAPPTSDAGIGGKYYGGRIVDRFIAIMGLNFRIGSVVKYVSRYKQKHKDPLKQLEDLKKAHEYLGWEIDDLQEQINNPDTGVIHK